MVVEGAGEGFVKKLVCYPDSYVAEDMVTACIAGHHREYGLHRLGITMHVLADTFAHQGFAGVNHKINEAENLKKQDEESSSLLENVADYFGDFFDKTTSRFDQKRPRSNRL